MNLETGAWKGERCFVVGNGPSREALDLRRVTLSGAKVIACNVAAFEIDATVTVAIDPRVYEKWVVAWAALHALGGKLVIPYAAEPYPLHDWFTQIKAAPSKYPKATWSERIEDGITMQDCSGISALNLACILGADPIIMVGFDLKPTKDGLTSNPGGLYDPSWRTNAEQVYANTVKAFEMHAADAKRGRRIFNTNPSSALRCFDMIDFDSATK